MEPIAAHDQREARGDVRVLLGVSAILVASAVVHTCVFLVNDTPWEGHISWRKPIAFALSFAITNLTLAWVLGLLPRATGKARFLGPVFGLTGLAEVGFITMQQWRGVPSHFNTIAPFDLGVVIVMGCLFLPLLAALIGIAIWSWRSLPRGTNVALGMRIGLVFLLVGQVAGVVIILQAIDLLEASRGRVAPLYPTINAYKIPHALGLHAIQALAVIGALADRVCKGNSTGKWIVLLASLALLAALGLSLPRAT